jgi:hypothetical protein
MEVQKQNGRTQGVKNLKLEARSPNDESTKSETRSSKQIQSPNIRYNVSNGVDRFGVLAFSRLRFIWLLFVSDFVLRISIFKIHICEAASLG